MKKLLFVMAAAVVLTACEKEINADGEPSATTEVELPTGEKVQAKRFVFTLKGDFAKDMKTRGYLAADGKDMTDVWVLDYMDEQLVQQLHQSNTDADFGAPSMSLAYGAHHVYVIASRGGAPTLDTTAKTIVWERPSDTFWKDYEVSVVATSNGNRAVTLDRVVTKLKLCFTDAVPAGAATFNITPATWYYGFNYQTGEPCDAHTSETLVLNIPSSYIGRTDTNTNSFGFSSATAWTTDVTFNCKDDSGNILGEASLSELEFRRNKQTVCTGTLFTAGGSVGLNLDTEWGDNIEVSW